MIELIVYEDGKVNVLDDVENIKRYVKRKDVLLWINIEKPKDDDMRFLQDNFTFHPLAIEDCMTAIQRPKIDRYNDYLFIVLHAASLGPHKDKATSLELDTFLGPNYIITIHMKPIKSLTATKERVIKNPQTLLKGSCGLFYHITDALVDNYFPILDILDNEIEKAEQSIFVEKATDSINKVLTLKKNILTLRRFIGPQREIINFIARGDYQPLITADSSLYFRDIFDLLSRISDTLDTYRDILTNVLDGYHSVISNRLNEVMKVLTVIATIVMPLTLVTGIYGMNFEHMPELSWKYGYFSILFLMVIIALGMLYFFKQKKLL